MRYFKRSIFKEARFIFNGEEGSFFDKLKAEVDRAAGGAETSKVKPLGVPDVPADAEKKEAAAKKAAAKAETKTAAKKGLEKGKTGIKLDKLKSTMGTQYQEVVGVLNLSGEKFGGGVGRDLNFSGGPKDLIAQKIESALKEVDLKKFLDFVGGDEKTAPVTIAEIYATSIAEKAGSEFNTKYPKFDKFLEANTKYSGIKILFNVKFDQFSASKEPTKFAFDPTDFKKAYQEFAKPTGEKPKEKPKAKIDKLRNAKIAALEGSMLGMFLVAIGVVKKGEFDKVYSGQNGIANKIISIFGGGNLLKDEIAYKKMKKNPKSKIAGQLTRWEKAARGSVLSLASVEVGDEDVAKAKEATEKAKAYTSVSPKNLGKIFEGQKVNGIDESKMKVGIKLNSTFEIGGKKQPKSIKISFEKDGKMILPKGKTIENGKIVPGKTESYGYKDTVDVGIEISGNIPAGTIFQGKMDFVVTT